MIANSINGKIRVFNAIPKVFELKPNVFNYDKLDEQIHYNDGFRHLDIPTLEVNQYLTNIYFDADNDIFTYNVETYTPEQIKENEVNNEFNLYQQRQNEGMNLYLKHEAEWRTMFINEQITKDQFNVIEDSFKPVRLELGFGQLKSALTLLKEINPTRVTDRVYNKFYSDLETLISELYVN